MGFFYDVLRLPNKEQLPLKVRSMAGLIPLFAVGETEKFQSDPNWRDLVPFHECFPGDNGKGIGASHQTGWTGLVARLLRQSGE